jgi:hypothetical protein
LNNKNLEEMFFLGAVEKRGWGGYCHVAEGEKQG